jgi:hypothetical protein
MVMGSVWVHAQVKLTPYVLGTWTNIHFNELVDPTTQEVTFDNERFDPEMGYQIGLRAAWPINEKLYFITDFGLTQHRFRFRPEGPVLAVINGTPTAYQIEKIQYKHNAAALRAGIAYDWKKLNIGLMAYGQYNGKSLERAKPFFSEWTENFTNSQIKDLDIGLTGSLINNWGRFCTIIRYDLGLMPQSDIMLTDATGVPVTTVSLKTNSVCIGFGYTFGKSKDR